MYFSRSYLWVRGREIALNQVFADGYNGTFQTARNLVVFARFPYAVALFRNICHRQLWTLTLKMKSLNSLSCVHIHMNAAWNVLYHLTRFISGSKQQNMKYCHRLMFWHSLLFHSLIHRLFLSSLYRCLWYGRSSNANTFEIIMPFKWLSQNSLHSFHGCELNSTEF